MTLKNYGRIHWDLDRDNEGHREYTIKWLIEDTTASVGPGLIIYAPDVPIIGSTWNYGGDNDPWAFCLPRVKASPLTQKDPSQWWIVENSFSSKPLNRCQDSQPGNPASEPDKIRGSFVKYTKEITRDRNNKIITSSSLEPIRGGLMEFDNNRPNVSITKHLLTLPLATFAPMVDKVNGGGMWGLSRRMVKLSNATWERHFYGTCNRYYTVTYDFDVDYATFDRKAIDQGMKVLSDGGDPDNPDDYEVYKDVNGENTVVLLNGAGAPLSDKNSPVVIPIEYYEEANFFALGIPTSF